MEYNIERLLQLSKANNGKCTIATDFRYAGEMKDGRFGLYKDNFILLTYPKLERTIRIYGEDIEKASISVEYNLPDFETYYIEDIEESNLTALHENDLLKYFEVTDTIIIHTIQKETITKRIAHKDTIHYKNGFYLEDLNAGLKAQKKKYM